MTKRFCIAIIITIVQFFFCFSEAKKDLVQQNSNDRALQLLKQMTLDEKIHMLHGQYGTYVGNVPAIDRLGIPSLNLQDGPQGFRVSKSSVGAAGTTTCWPSALTMSSAWDTDLAFRWASAMGLEFKNKGANVQLAPGLGLARVPTAGRNFEYLSGEDPVLGSMMAEQVVKGIQSNGIIANAKHWVNNEIEDQRRRVSSNVNERTRFEIYYPPFEAAVKAGVLSVMCSYNRINDIYACENPELYSHLRNNLNFTGWVMSDWFATKSTVPSVISGLDQEMPIGLYFSDRELKAKLSSGNITESMLDEKVLRILTSMYTIGLFDSPNTGHPKADVTSDAHNALAREIAAKSTVLLKNENNLLPLNAVELSTYGESSCIAVFGDEQTISGGGSGHVEPAYIVTPTQGIMESIRHKLGPKGDDKLPVYYIDSSKDVETIKAFAEQCKVSVVVVATSSKEGSDRENLSFSQDQNDLVTLVAGANPKGTIVNVRNPGAVLMPWADLVPSILVSWLPGQEAGNGLADVLFGDVNPSGRLSVTMPNKENEVGFSKLQYPGVGKIYPEAYYIEELLVGYRWYNAKDVMPLFPFGHGLSYTQFLYTDLSVSKLSANSIADVVGIDVTIRNIGDKSGSEVVQLYITFPVEAREPKRQLKGFVKTASLEPITSDASSTIVHFTLTQRDLSIWDEDSHQWKFVSGVCQVEVGASSADVRVNSRFSV